MVITCLDAELPNIFANIALIKGCDLKKCYNKYQHYHYKHELNFWYSAKIKIKKKNQVRMSPIFVNRPVRYYKPLIEGLFDKYKNQLSINNNWSCTRKSKLKGYLEPLRSWH